MRPCAATPSNAVLDALAPGALRSLRVRVLRPLRPSSCCPSCSCLSSCGAVPGRAAAGLGLAVRNHSPTGPAGGYGGSGPTQLALAILLAVTDEATAERFLPAVPVERHRADRGGPLGTGRRRRPRRARSRRPLGTDNVVHLAVDESCARRLLGDATHLPGGCTSTLSFVPSSCCPSSLSCLRSADPPLAGFLVLRLPPPGVWRRRRPLPRALKWAPGRLRARLGPWDAAGR